MPAKTWKIFCIVDGEKSSFSVNIPKNETVDDLKKAIKAEKAIAFANIDADKLTLYKINILEDAEFEGKLKDLFNAEPPPELLNPTKKLKAIFESSGPAEDTVHILVHLPRSGADESMQMTRRNSPPLAMIGLGTALRRGTVEALYKRLDHYHLVLVRGTPASGKSTLAMLLRDYIREIARVDPVVLNTWPKDDVTWMEKLERGGYNRKDPNTIIIDEAQLSYWDDSFWNGFLKSITSESRDRVILFASYGSPTGRVSVEGTPMVVPDQQRVSLRPVYHLDEHPPLPAVGLLLTAEEFNDMVDRGFEAGCFDNEFLEYVFRVTAGHAGAVFDLLRVVSSHDSYRGLKGKNGTYTLEIFKTQLALEALWSGLLNVGVFRRGLPSREELQQLQIARVFRTVLVNNSVTMTMLEPSDQKTLDHCFKLGWLHATTDGAENRYIFTTPLHQWFVEYYLGTSVSNSTLITDQSLLQFTIKVIRLFSRSQLSSERKIGASSMQRPPEAQFQDEFYRCCHKYSNGSLISFPEFGDAKGRVDFYIPCNEWGVELLREGNRLESHSSRFIGQGAYAKMKFSDYIILDFRTIQPRDAHPKIRNLYHIVFNNDYNDVCILSGDSLEEITKFGLLK